MIVPGRLQTDSYARALLAGYRAMFKLPGRRGTPGRNKAAPPESASHPRSAAHAFGRHRLGLASELSLFEEATPGS
jgi:hypothetical protein